MESVHTSEEVITKAEAARRWGITRPAVGKYRTRGMPERPDGLLDWPAVDQWRQRTNDPEKSGSYRVREEFQRGESVGASAMCAELRAAARKDWPEFVALINLAGIPAEMRLPIRVIFASLMAFLLDCWPGLPGSIEPANWMPVGSDAVKASAEFTELVGEWRSALIELRSRNVEIAGVCKMEVDSK